MSAEYPIDTLAQMAAIPDEALPRFFAELPAILQSARKTPGLKDAMQAMVGDDVKFVACGVRWVDDNLDTFGVEISTTAGDVLYSLSVKREG